jgi:hypothetical protein
MGKNRGAVICHNVTLRGCVKRPFHEMIPEKRQIKTIQRRLLLRVSQEADCQENCQHMQLIAGNDDICQEHQFS